MADADVTHNKFTLVRNELENYRRPSDMIKMKDSQWGDNKINKTRFIYPSKKWLGSTQAEWETENSKPKLL